jgi:hypothetical protein
LCSDVAHVFTASSLSIAFSCGRCTALNGGVWPGQLLWRSADGFAFSKVNNSGTGGGGGGSLSNNKNTAGNSSNARSGQGQRAAPMVRALSVYGTRGVRTACAIGPCGPQVAAGGLAASLCS